MISQVEKDALLSTARTAYEQVFNAISSMAIETMPTADLQAQLTSLQTQLTAVSDELNTLKIVAASLQSKIDMVRAAIN
jgi:phage shock protein A